MSFFAFQDIITAAAGIMILVTLIMALDIGEPPTPPSPELAQQNPELQTELTRLIHQLTLAGQTNSQLRSQWVEVQKRPNPKEVQRDIERLTNEVDRAQQKIKQDEDKARSANDAVKEEDRRLGLDGLRNQLNEIQAGMEGLSKKVVIAKQQTAVLEQQIRQIRSHLLVVKSREGQLWLVPDPNATTKEPILVVISGKDLTVERFDRPSERVTLTGQTSLEFKARLTQYNKLNQYFVFYIRPSGIATFDQINDFSKDAGFDIGYEPLAESQVIHFSKPKEPATDIPPAPPSGSSEPPKSSPPSSTTNAAPSSTPSAATPPPATPQSPPQSKPTPLSFWQRIKNWLGFS